MGKRTNLRVTARVGIDGPTFTAFGRDAWALLELLKAGERGCTPIDQPGPRWSAYIFNLRQRGLVIETVHENHTVLKAAVNMTGGSGRRTASNAKS